MRYFIFLVCLIVTACVSQKSSVLDEPVTIIKNVTVFTGEKLIENTNLVYRNDRIVEINRKVKSYKNAELIDGTGKTIIPPLVNAHVHLFGDLYAKASLKTGIFANLDMHNQDYVANWMRGFNDSLYFPKYYSSNAGVTVPKGHGTQFGVPVPTVNDSISPSRFVQDRVKAHADYIKILKESSMATLSDEQTHEAIQEAHRNGLLAVGHSHRVKDTGVLVEQGINGIVHIWFDNKADDRLLSQMSDGKVFLIPTLLVTRKAMENRRVLGNALSFKDILEEVNRANKAGVSILCGTDPPNFKINFTDNLYDEMELLVQAGLSNAETLKSATTNTYKAFSLESFGELKSGTLADFILVEGNPAKNISDIRKAKMVIKEGQLIHNGL